MDNSAAATRIPDRTCRNPWSGGDVNCREHRRGAVLVWLIGLLLLFSSLFVALFSLNRSGEEGLLLADSTNRAQLLAESGLNYALAAACSERDSWTSPRTMTLPTGDFYVIEFADTNAASPFSVTATVRPATAAAAQARVQGTWPACVQGLGNGPAGGDYVITSVTAPSLGGSQVYGDVAVIGEVFNYVGGGGSQGTFIEGDVLAGQGVRLSGAAIIRGNIYSDGDVNITQGFVRGDVHNGGDFDIHGSSRLNGSVYSGGSISLGGNARVIRDLHSCTGDVRVSGSTFVGGSIYAQGNVEVSGSAVVRGSVYARGNVTVSALVKGDVVAGGNLTAGSGAGIRVEGNSHSGGTISITGSSYLGGNATAAVAISQPHRVNGISCAPCSPQLPLAPRCPELFDFSTLAPLPRTTFSAGTAAIGNGNNRQSIVLAPGSYGVVNLSGSESELWLRGGSYYLAGLAIGWNGRLYLDLSSGMDIRLFIAGNVSISNLRVYVSTSGLAGDYPRAIDRSNGVALIDENLASYVYLETHGNFSTGGQCDWFGTIHAPDGDIAVAKGSVVIGAVFGQQSISVRGVVLRFVPPRYFNP